MVRFIIQTRTFVVAIRNLIYIPIWLDLLCIIPIRVAIPNTDLHSNMVRFIIPAIMLVIIVITSFTFQYG